MRAVVVGFDYFARYLTDLMNEHSKHWELEVFPSTRIGMIRALWRLGGADALISFGGPAPDGPLTVAARERRIPIIVIWAGTDLLVAAENPFDLEIAKWEVSLDLAGAPWLAEEARALGVPARYQPITAVDAPPSVAPMPQRFTVLTYLPVPRRTFYGEDRVYAVARALKDVHFIVVGRGGRSPSSPPNVEFRGWVKNMASAIDDSSVLLRLPEHDGPALMVLESLSRGRHVVWTHEFPGVRQVRSMPEALSVIRELYEQHCRAELQTNDAGRDFVARNCTRAGVAAGLDTCFAGTTLRRIPSSNGRRKRVAVSGLAFFCAQVAREIEALHPEWDVQILRSSSRLDTLVSLVNLTRADVWYSIGGPFSSRWMHYWARLCGIPRVMHWVGSDVESLRTDASLRRHVLASPAAHLAEIEWIARELAVLGIDCDIAPLPLRHQARESIKTLPERFTIMLYVPKSRPEFYGVREYERLLEEFAHEAPRVFVVGGGRVRAPAPVEVIECGWCSDLRDLYEQSTVLIRRTPRDGLSLMVVEALSFGRHVLWSKPFPHATQVRSYSEVSTALRELFEQHRSGSLLAQYAAAEFVRKRYATDRCVDTILGALDTARIGVRPAEVIA